MVKRKIIYKCYGVINPTPVFNNSIFVNGQEIEAYSKKQAYLKLAFKFKQEYPEYNITVSEWTKIIKNAKIRIV